MCSTSPGRGLSCRCQVTKTQWRRRAADNQLPSGMGASRNDRTSGPIISLSTRVM